MSVLIDPPRWPAHGRAWSHLVSDESMAELHSFARRLGIPTRAFSGDHYDVPQERYAEAVRAGAEAVEGKVLLARLVASGLRVPKRRGERLVSSRRVRDWLPGTGAATLDLIVSGLSVPHDRVVARLVVTADPRGRLLMVPTADGWALPEQPAPAEDTTGRGRGYHRLRPDGDPAPPWSYVLYLAAAASPPTFAGRWLDPADPAVLGLDAWPLVRVVLDPG